MIHRTAAMLAGVLFLGLGSTSAKAQDAIDLDVPIDARKAESERISSSTLKTLEGLKNYSLVCLDVKAMVDGSQTAAILTSNEGDTRRYPVDCRKDQPGSFPMASGVEYYLPAVAKSGKADVDIEVYPGTRTSHQFNDVSCVPAKGNSATFRLSGFYTVRTHDFGERRVIEFRPAPPGPGVSREAAAACLD